MRSYKTDAIIVKRRNFGEADRVLTVLTKNYGKIQVRAPGVRRIVSRRSSHIELLNLSTLTLYKSFRASIPIVTEAQAQEEFLTIKNNLKKIGLAYYICELIDRLCADNQENRKIFFLAKDTLFALCHAELVSASRKIPKQVRDDNEYVTSSIVSDFEEELLVSLGFLQKQHRLMDKRSFIENILERKLTTKRLLPLFTESDSVFTS